MCDQRFISRGGMGEIRGTFAFFLCVCVWGVSEGVSMCVSVIEIINGAQMERESNGELRTKMC